MKRMKEKQGKILRENLKQGEKNGYISAKVHTSRAYSSCRRERRLADSVSMAQTLSNVIPQDCLRGYLHSLSAKDRLHPRRLCCSVSKTVGSFPWAPNANRPAVFRLICIYVVGFSKIARNKYSPSHTANTGKPCKAHGKKTKRKKNFTAFFTRSFGSVSVFSVKACFLRNVTLIKRFILGPKIQAYVRKC